MATLTAPNVGKAIIHFTKAKAHAETQYAKMQNCKSCDREVARQWKESAEFFQDLINQLKGHVEP